MIRNNRIQHTNLRKSNHNTITRLIILPPNVKWQYKAHGDQWLDYTDELCERFEILTIGRQNSFYNENGIKNIIRRISINTASHFMRFSYGDTTPRECRRVNTIIQPLNDELDAVKADQKSMKMKIKQYEQRINEIEADNLYKEEQISQQYTQEFVNNEDMHKLNIELKTIQQQLIAICQELPDRSQLTSKQTAKMVILKLLINNEDEYEVITYLRKSNWNLRDAVDKYYYDKLQYQQIWEWMDDDKKWQRYEEEQNDFFNDLYIGETARFSIYRNEYIFSKITADTGTQLNMKTLKTRDCRKIKIKKYGNDGADMFAEGYIWEWKNDNNEWIPYIEDKIKQFEKLKIYEAFTFIINGHQYRVRRTGENTAIQFDETKKYKVIDASIKDNNNKNVWNPSNCNLTLHECKRLIVGSMIDFRDNKGQFHGARIIEKEGQTRFYIHYEDNHEDNEWCDCKKSLFELNRFAKYKSISNRPAHRLKNVKIKDYVNINPIGRHPRIGWRLGIIRKIDNKSGQIQVAYQRYDGSHWYNYWVHRDNVNEIAEGRYLLVYASPKQRNHIYTLLNDTIVTVEEFDGEYCRISNPCIGWICKRSLNGKTKIEKLSWDTTKREVRRRKVIKRNRNENEWVDIWKWFDDDNKWRTYSKQQMDIINNIEVGRIGILMVGDNTYSFAKTTDCDGKQTNVKTYKERKCKKVRVRQCDGIRYPDFWIDTAGYYDFDGDKLYYKDSDEELLDEDYMKSHITTVTMFSMKFEEIANKFIETMKDYEVIKIENITNEYLLDRYNGAKEIMIKTIGDINVNERCLWRGDDNIRIRKYMTQGFRKEEFSFNKNIAQGIELTVDADQNINISTNTMIYCKALCGESALVSKDIKLTSWPLKRDGSGQLYDSLVDNLRHPWLYYIHDDARVYPMYVVHFWKK